MPISNRRFKVLFAVIVIVSSVAGCKEEQMISVSPPTLPPQVTSPAFPAGTNLNVEVRQGSTWVEGITYSNPEFTVAEMETDTYTGFLGTVKTGFKYIVARVELTNTTDKLLEIDLSAEGYNAAGGQLSKKFYFDAVFTLEHIPPGGSETGRIFMTWSEDIKNVTLNTHLIIHNPGTLVPASELYTINFSKKWLLENDADPQPYSIMITFPEDWLNNAPSVLAGDEPILFTMPKELFNSYIRSNVNGMITAGSFNTYMFKGLPVAPIPPPPT